MGQMGWTQLEFCTVALKSMRVHCKLGFTAMNGVHHESGTPKYGILFAFFLAKNDV